MPRGVSSEVFVRSSYFSDLKGWIGSSFCGETTVLWDPSVAVQTHHHPGSSHHGAAGQAGIETPVSAQGEVNLVISIKPAASWAASNTFISDRFRNILVLVAVRATHFQHDLAAHIQRSLSVKWSVHGFDRTGNLSWKTVQTASNFILPGARNELQGAEKFSTAAGCEEFYTHQAGQDTWTSHHSPWMMGNIGGNHQFCWFESRFATLTKQINQDWGTSRIFTQNYAFEEWLCPVRCEDP